MAEAQGNQQEEREKLAQAFQETLIVHMASEEERLAKVRGEATEINVGTIKKGQISNIPSGASIVATFGRSKVVNKNGQTTVETPEAPVYEIDTNKVVAAAISGKKPFDVAEEFRKMRSLTDTNEREDTAQLLYVNIAQQATVAQERIRGIAAQEGGVVDAKAALDKWAALEVAGLQTGKLKQGDHYHQTDEARKTYQAALGIANQLETDLIKKDPELANLRAHTLLLDREFAQLDRRQSKSDDAENKFGPMTSERLTNARFALGLADNTTRIIPQVHSELKKNRALATVLDAGKADMPRLLVDQDMNVRRYAYKILEGMERVNLKLGPDEKLPAYVTVLEPLIADRMKLLSPERIAAFGPVARQLYADSLKPEKNVTTGEKAKSEAKNSLLLKILEAEIEATGLKKYQDIKGWTFTDPQFKAVIDGISLNSKDKQGRVVMSDGIAAVMRTELKNPDGSKMTPQQKIQGLLNSVDISMSNDKGSFILPSVENYKAPLSADVRNEAMRAYVRETMRLGRFVGPLAFISDATIGEALIGEPGIDLESGIAPPGPVDVTTPKPQSNNKGNTSDTGFQSLLGAKRG